MPDAYANFALTTVAVAPSPATTGTTLTVAAGTGAYFAAAPFNATVVMNGAIATNAIAEIVRVTEIDGDQLTIVRGPQSNDPGGINRTIGNGDWIYAGSTEKTFNDIWAAINALGSVSITWRDGPSYVLPSDTSPSSSATVVASRPIDLAPGQSANLIGVRSKCSTVGSTPSVFAIATDHGEQGTLATVSGLGAITPATGAYVEILLSTPFALSDGDEVAVLATTPGGSLGPKVAPIIQYTA
jgi:hypothetical protein